MKSSNLFYLVASVLIAFYSCTPDEDVERKNNTPDTELVKCLEQKIIGGDIKPHDYLVTPSGVIAIFENDYPSSNEMWVGDSIEINIVTSSIRLDGEYVTSAYVTLVDEVIELTEHESDRLVEITMNQYKKLDKIRESKQKAHQDSLRTELTKHCK